MKDIGLYSKRCWINGRLCEATIHVKDEKIHEVYQGKKELPNIKVSDFDTSIVMPGIIDAHVHINEPGRTEWEGFETATQAAALGGVTTLIEMPLNASPVTTNVKAFKIKLAAAKGKLEVNCGFYGGVIPHNDEDIGPLIESGVFGIKGFLVHSGIEEFPNTTRVQLEAIAPILAKYDIPLLLHCELETDEELPVVVDSKSYLSYLKSRPQSWEIKAIEVAIDIQSRFDIKVHIVHLSAADALPLIIEARSKSNRLTVETCAHYLYFNSEDIPNAAPIYKCAPPIREKHNNRKLWEAVKNGQIDFLASDHSPAPPSIKKLKDGNLFEAWGGIAGLQFTLPALWSSNDLLSLEEFIPLVTSNPAKFLGLENYKGFLKKGYDADITIWEEEKTFEVTKESIAHRHKESPYIGERLKGKVQHCMVNGKFVIQNGKFESLKAGIVLLKP